MCLDLESYQKKIEIFGSWDSDETQWLDLIYEPCAESDPGCRVKEFKREDGTMDTDALWD